jgi:hypothetical protein
LLSTISIFTHYFFNVFNVTINPLNDAPVITQGNTVTVDMDEDGSPTAFALTLSASDIDDDLLSWSLQTPASEGTANASGNGASPAIDYQPAPDYSGSDSFVVRVADGNGGNTDITVTVNIAEINDAPTLTGPAYISAVENVALSVSPTTLSDVENDTLTVTASGLPAWASLNNASGEITGTPGADTVGQVYEITLTASDGQASSTLDLTIEVRLDLALALTAGLAAPFALDGRAVAAGLTFTFARSLALRLALGGVVRGATLTITVG